MDGYEFQDWHILIVFLVGFFGLCFGIVAIVSRTMERQHRPYREEQERARDLAVRGSTAWARVIAWEGGGGSPQEGLEGFRLTVAYETDGLTHQVRFPVWIDNRLAINFAPGSSVPLLVDPQDPQAVAIDRSRATLDVPLGAA